MRRLPDEQFGDLVLLPGLPGVHGKIGEVAAEHLVQCGGLKQAGIRRPDHDGVELSRARQRGVLEALVDVGDGVLAEDELRHAMRLDAVHAGEIKLSPEEIGSLGIAEKIGSRKITADMSYADALAAAIVKEQNAFRLYTLIASKMHDKDVKAMFLLLAEEEAKHKLKLEIEYDLATF